jgi:imidazolonepropionase-like amidohydrolase
MRINKMQSFSRFGAAALAFAAALPGQTVAIRAGRVIMAPGHSIEGATILIRGGRIEQIGADVTVPFDAKVIDATKQVAMATYVLAHTSGGMRSGNENLANVPYLAVQDAVDPASSFFAEALRNGVGTIHVIPGHQTLVGGQGMICKPYGQTPEDLTIRGKGALKLSLESGRGGRMEQVRKMRAALVDVADYIADHERRKKEFEAEKAAGVPEAVKKDQFDDPIDPLKKPTVDLLQGKNTAHLYVPDAALVPEALRLVAQHNLQCVFVLGPRCYKAARMFVGLGTPVVLDGALEIWEKDDDTTVERRVCPAVEFYKLGIPFAIGIGESDATRYPWWQAATLVRNGIERTAALHTLTTVPAQVLGIADEVGTLEPGKRANIQLLTGDPLQAMTWVDKVLLDGELVYERDKDPRLQHLFGKGDAK